MSLHKNCMKCLERFTCSSNAQKFCVSCRTLTCPRCGKGFVSTSRHYDRKFCSKDCFYNTPEEERRKKHLDAGKVRRAKLRLLIISLYSRGTNRCSCCGEEQMEFLSIDHVNGGGNQHRAKIGGNLHQWLKVNGFPAGFDVLCFNCNYAKGRYGTCPHKTKNHVS